MSLQQPVRRVAIVGGGSSGWMTAAYLSKAFGPEIDVTVVESGTINTIGVGEATFSDIHLFFEFLGLREEDWMRECNAGYKIAIRFAGWNAEGRTFDHPFERPALVDGRSMAEWWLQTHPQTPYDRACFVSSRLCDAQRAPRFPDGRVYDESADRDAGRGADRHQPRLLEDLQIQYPYAYHFDASLFANVLARYAAARGVRRVIDDVIDVEMGDSGDIAALRTKEHGRIAADLFVDCTGFRGRLINQALGEPFISFLESLPCDRAVAMQVPSDGGREGMAPYTMATALSAGWVWTIPLFHRLGSGYVYSSACVTADEAEREFRAFLGPPAEGRSALHIKMRVGRTRDAWVRNCVAIGLSAGFVEPLESTGLFFAQHGIEQLVSHFPWSGCDDATARSYNRIVADCIDGVREFLTLHYVASSRADTTFWRLTKHELHVPDALAERLRLWKERLPTRRTIGPAYHGFGPHNYTAMLMGLGWRPDRPLRVLQSMDPSRADIEFAHVRDRAALLARTLPSQYEYLASKYARREDKEVAWENRRSAAGSA